MLNIKVLGIGGTKYFDLVKNLNRAIQKLDFEVQIEFLKEVEDFIKYEILEIPALVIDEIVIAKGIHLDEEEIKHYLIEMYENALQETEQM